MKVKRSIAIIGEGETEWFYFDSLRITCRFPFKVAPDFPQHSDIPHMAKLAEEYVKREYDYIVCLVDMDRLVCNPKEMATYHQLMKKSSKNVIWIETNPCTEFWFLLHFLPQLSMRHYDTYEDLLLELQKYMPGYEKTSRYFKRTNLYKFLLEHGDIPRALNYAEELSRLSSTSKDNSIAYSQIHRVFSLLSEMKEDNGNKDQKESTKEEKQKRIGDKCQEIVDFVTENGFSDAKSISKAIGLKVSRTRDYLKELTTSGQIIIRGEYRARKYGPNPRYQ